MKKIADEKISIGSAQIGLNVSICFETLQESNMILTILAEGQPLCPPSNAVSSWIQS